MSRKKVTIDTHFSKRLRILLEERLKIKREEFRSKIGISSGYLAMLLTEKRGPSAELIAGIFTHYREHLYWLLTGEGDPYIYKDTIPDKDKIDPTIKDLLKSARRVLESGNQVAFDALERNIRYFDHAIQTEKRLQQMETRLSKLEEDNTHNDSRTGHKKTADSEY